LKFAIEIKKFGSQKVLMILIWIFKVLQEISNCLLLTIFWRFSSHKVFKMLQHSRPETTGLTRKDKRSPRHRHNDSYQTPAKISLALTLESSPENSFTYGGPVHAYYPFPSHVETYTSFVPVRFIDLLDNCIFRQLISDFPYDIKPET
jgi:hypothetical protein